ncbi:hypothetical protein [Gluconacetobacter tumulisoli]|uniref:Uncharacterized protein n=1 Tax=Gluconacetobacter tumulisoli TaxID=1286189 RepID=A0A7W4PMG2_9PROT|nr:hypothetical protein [Gluconacetobacter tumulisoli]MBB2201609.1 hypothetical protein [Gluconacetobacter tumulisoli]
MVSQPAVGQFVPYLFLTLPKSQRRIGRAGVAPNGEAGIDIVAATP